MTDKRRRCHATPPGGRAPRCVQVLLDPEDYRALYEITMQRGLSMADTLRQIIREAAHG